MSRAMSRGMSRGMSVVRFEDEPIESDEARAPWGSFAGTPALAGLGRYLANSRRGLGGLPKDVLTEVMGAFYSVLVMFRVS